MSTIGIKDSSIKKMDKKMHRVYLRGSNKERHIVAETARSAKGAETASHRNDP